MTFSCIRNLFNQTISLLIFIFSLFFLSGTLLGQEIVSEHSVRLMSYNIRTARGLDNVQDYDRIAAILKSKDPDVVALQELDRNNERSHNDDIVAELATRTGMNASFAGAISFQGGEYGVGILSKEKPIQIRQLALPGTEEKRTFLIAEFEHYFFCCTHFSLTENDRNASVELIQKEMKDETKIVFMAGDFNAEPQSTTIKAITQNWVILSGLKSTFPADSPDICIDYIFGMDPSRKNNVNDFCWKNAILKCEVLNEPLASDHRPIFVEFDLSVIQ